MTESIIQPRSEARSENPAEHLLATKALARKEMEQRRYNDLQAIDATASFRARARRVLHEVVQ